MKRYGLIGHPLGHSFSATYFNEKFAREGLDAHYDNYDLSDVRELLELVKNLGEELVGLNVTIPYKQAVIPYLDSLSDEARAIGAVNVIKFLGERMEGHNTDVIGFRESLRPLLKSWHKKAYILGTGGASKAVCHAMGQLNIEITLVSRSPKGENVISYEDLDAALRTNADVVIVNCTPLGMFPNVEACAPLPYEVLNERTLLYDLVYNPEETLFLRRGRMQGCITKNGIEMLWKQADAAWEIWGK